MGKNSERILNNEKGKVQNLIDNIDKKISNLQSQINQLNLDKSTYQSQINDFENGIKKVK